MQSEAFDTMGNLKEINGYIRPTPDKLPSIVRIKTTEDCQEQDFCQCIEALRKWADGKRLEDKQKLNPKKRGRL